MTDLIEVQTSTLAGAALDWAVAKATGADDLRITAAGSICCIYELPCGSGCWTEYYQPCTDWSVGGPLIERETLHLFSKTSSQPWAATNAGGFVGFGSTPLVAACRAIVAAKLGDTVQVPKELI